jgi:hypothetical protein
MNVLGGLLYLSGACALLFGIGTTIWPVAMFGFTRRQEGVFVIVAALLAMGLGQMMGPETGRSRCANRGCESVGSRASSRPIRSASQHQNGDIQLAEGRWRFPEGGNRHPQ